MERWKTSGEVERHPDKVSGAWVFRETRVSVSALFENLRDGATVEQFLEWFPGVKKDQVEAVLNHEVESLSPATLRVDEISAIVDEMAVGDYKEVAV